MRVVAVSLMLMIMVMLLLHSCSYQRWRFLSEGAAAGGGGGGVLHCWVLTWHGMVWHGVDSYRWVIFVHGGHMEWNGMEWRMGTGMRLFLSSKYNERRHANVQR